MGSTSLAQLVLAGPVVFARSPNQRADSICSRFRSGYGIADRLSVAFEPEIDQLEDEGLLGGKIVIQGGLRQLELARHRGQGQAGGAPPREHAARGLEDLLFLNTVSSKPDESSFAVAFEGGVDHLHDADALYGSDRFVPVVHDRLVQAVIEFQVVATWRNDFLFDGVTRIV